MNSPHYILEDSNFDLMYVRLCDIDIPGKKMVELFANSGDHDQTPHSVASDLVCTVCKVPFRIFQTTMG